MTSHPEQKPHEIYLGNSADWNQARLGSLATLRIGEVALDVDGGKIPPAWGLRPGFLARHEAAAYDTIMLGKEVARG